MTTDSNIVRLEAEQEGEMSGDDLEVIAGLIARWILEKRENPVDKQRDPRVSDG